VLDAALQRIVSAKRRGNMQTWVTRVASTSKLIHHVAKRLCDGGILRRQQGRVLLLFRRDTWPEESDPAPERQLVQRGRAAV
jgi:hypothetical protein